MMKIYFKVTFFLLIGILPITGNAFDFEKSALLFSITEELSALVDKKDASGENRNDGYIKIKVTGGTGAYKISCFSPYSIPTHHEGNELKLENIKSGDYLFVIQDSSGKTLTKEVKIFNNQ